MRENDKLAAQELQYVLAQRRDELIRKGRQINQANVTESTNGSDTNPNNGENIMNLRNIGLPPEQVVDESDNSTGPPIYLTKAFSEGDYNSSADAMTGITEFSLTQQSSPLWDNYPDPYD